MPDSDQGYNTESVNFWVEPEQKARWLEHLEHESEYQYLSQLVRNTVEQYISRNGGASNLNTCPTSGR